LTQRSDMIDVYAQTAFEHAAIGLAGLDSQGRFLYTNPYLQKLFGFSVKKFTSLNFDEIVHPRSKSLLNEIFSKSEVGDQTHTLKEFNCFDSNGNSCWFDIKLTTIVDNNNEKQFIAVFEPTVTANAAIQNPHIGRKLFEAIAESIPTTLWLSDAEGEKLHFVNQAFIDTWELSREQALASSAEDLLEKLHPDDRKHIYNFSKEIINDRWNTNIRIITSDKKTRYLESTGTILRDHNNKAQYLLGVHHDITDSVVRAHKLETLNQQLQVSYQEVTRLNQFDQLTNCYNRTAALVYISDAFYQYKRYDISSSLVYIDLNHFKEINDEYGHHAGDLILKSFVTYMKNRIRQTDTLGRLGGDEFILLFPGTNKENALLFLQKETMEFTTKISEDVELTLSYAAGVQECELIFESVDEWLEASDKVMYSEKARMRD